MMKVGDDQSNARRLFADPECLDDAPSMPPAVFPTRLPLLLLCLAAWMDLGCAAIVGPGSSGAAAVRTTPVVLWFEDFDTVMVGHARSFDYFTGGFVDVTDRAKHLRCIGPAVPLVVPPEASPPDRCDGMRGEITLSCSDGRRLGAEWWVEETCGSGYGQGRDASGLAFRVAYGGSTARAAVLADEASHSLAGKPSLPAVGEGAPKQKGGVSTGTAFFVSWQGDLLTNHHVVSGAERIQIKIDDDEFLDAVLVASDTEADLALLRVDAIRQPLSLQSASELTRGDPVFTLGYPLIHLQGQEQKATFGRVNALSGMKGDDRFAQVDVPIQPGNSGGPLIDYYGEVVGIMTSMLHPLAAMESAGVVPQNVNYALKSDLALELVTRELDEFETRAGVSDRPREITELVAEFEDSVVMVVAW